MYDINVSNGGRSPRIRAEDEMVQSLLWLKNDCLRSSLANRDVHENVESNGPEKSAISSSSSKRQRLKSGAGYKLPFAAPRPSHKVFFQPTKDAAGPPPATAYRATAGPGAFQSGASSKTKAGAARSLVKLPLHRKVTPTDWNDAHVASPTLGDGNRTKSTQATTFDLQHDRDDDESRQPSVRPVPGAEKNSQNATCISESTADPCAVYFGWIRHAATKTWRQVVKSFSDNREKYPSWSDEIGREVMIKLRDEKGIVDFFISRRQEKSHGTTGAKGGLDSKKLFDKQRNLLSTWSVATPQEVMERTKQRFIDDRKPQAPLSGAKRPRGRPRKPISGVTSIEMALESDPKAILKAVAALQKKLEHCLSKYLVPSLQNLVSSEVTDSTAEGSIKEYLLLSQEIEELKLLIWEQMETGLGQTDLVGSLSVSVIDKDQDLESNPRKVTCAHELPPNGNDSLAACNNMKVVQKRKPWFPVMPNHVCFGWQSHAGTAKWREAVKRFSDDSLEYPEWTNAIVDGVKDKLASDGCAMFLVFLDNKGIPSESIHEGLWYLATEKDVVEQTKQQFLLDRQHL